MPPHMVNYRAASSGHFGAEVLAINVVGSVGTDSGDLVIVGNRIHKRDR